MPAPGNADQQHIYERRAKVATYYLQGRTQFEIATFVGVSQKTVSQDLAEVRKEWLSKAVQDYGTRKAEELAKLDKLEEVAWAAWERSCEEAEVRHRKTQFVREHVKGQGRRGGGGLRLVPVTQVKELTTRGQCGDPRYLEQIRACVELRLKVLGLLKPDTNNVNLFNLNWDDLLGRQSARPASAVDDRLRAEEQAAADAVVFERKLPPPDSTNGSAGSTHQ